MSTLRITITKEGPVRVDIDLPVGTACDNADAELRAILEILGAGFEDTSDCSVHPLQPDGIPDGIRSRGGGGVR